MIISGRFWRRAIVTAVAAVGFASYYDVTALDSKYVARLATLHETFAPALPGSRLAFSATAYCKGIVTASGVPVQSGVAAADPELLPVGSVIEIDSAAPEIQRHLHRDGHRPQRAGAAGRRLHVELQRGLELRPQADSPDRAAPGMESARDHAELSRSLLQAAGGARAPASQTAGPVPFGKLEVDVLLPFHFHLLTSLF